MPGIVGFIHNEQQADSSSLLNKMCQVVKHENWYKIDQYVDDFLAIGRLHLGIINPEPQPIFNDDKSLGIMMIGEIYDYQALKRALESKGHKFVINNDPEFILHLYEEYGEEFVNKLNGSFVVVVWDIRRRKLLIVNDHYSLRPFYYTNGGGKLIFASEVKAIIQNPTFDRIVNDTAVAQFFTFSQPLENETFFKGINALPPASILIYQDGVFSLRQYWDFQFVESYSERSMEDYIEELNFFLQQAIARQMSGDCRIGMGLSGGLDTRLILAFIDRKYFPIFTYTFGMPGCYDIRFAKKVSQRLGSDHHFFELEPDYLLEFARKAAWLTDGMYSMIHSHVIASLEQGRQHIQVYINGLAGDLILGGSYLEPQLFGIENGYELSKKIFEKFNINIKSIDQPKFFSKEYYEKIKGLAFVSLTESLERLKTTNSANKSDHFFLQNRVRRFTICGLVIVGSLLEYRAPFYDYDFMDYVHANIPPEFRMDHKIYIELMAKKFPNLSRIPWQKTGLPLKPSYFDYLVPNIKNRVTVLMQKAGLQRSVIAGRQNFADYDLWMRTYLKDFVQGILLDRKTLDRGYFNRKYVVQMVQDHMEGKRNLSEQLSALITFELWHRMFMDKQ